MLMGRSCLLMGGCLLIFSERGLLEGGKGVLSIGLLCLFLHFAFGLDELRYLDVDMGVKLGFSFLD